MAAEEIWARYTGDNGLFYSVRVRFWLGTMADWGFAAWDAADPVLPRNVKHRRVILINPATGRRRQVHAGSASCAAYQTLGTSYTMPNADGTSSAFVTTGRIGERTLQGPHGS